MHPVGIASSAVTAFVAVSSLFLVANARSSCGRDWVTVWGSMPQLTETANLPPAPFTKSGVVFENATIRQTVKVSLDADKLRLQISNAFGGSDLPITAVTLALPSNQTAGIRSIQADTVKKLTFSGSESFIVPNGASVLSDTIEFPVEAQSLLSVSIYLQRGQTTNLITSHPGSRTTSWFLAGNHVDSADLEGAASADHWYLVNSIEAQLGGGASAIAFVGDSITDGRGSTVNGNDRWPDRLLARMQNTTGLENIAILNVAAGGNRILADGLGPNALGRIDRDVIGHTSICYAIVFEGVNDIGTAPTDTASQARVGDRIIEAYEQMIMRMQRHGILVFGGTITPMTGPGQAYGHPNREVTRQRMNEWIRTSGKFDAVIDFDEAVRDPGNHEILLEKYDTGDHLHLNAVGYEAMAAVVDLALFERS
jgi:lysophospholipase L1-like esterase